MRGDELADAARIRGAPRGARLTYWIGGTLAECPADVRAAVRARIEAGEAHPVQRPTGARASDGCRAFAYQLIIWPAPALKAAGAITAGLSPQHTRVTPALLDRMIALAGEKLTHKEIALRLGLGAGTVTRYIVRERRFGALAPREDRP